MGINALFFVVLRGALVSSGDHCRNVAIALLCGSNVFEFRVVPAYRCRTLSGQPFNS